LHESSLAARVKAAIALTKLGPEAKSTVRDLTIALHDENPLVRGQVAAGLGAIGPAAAEAVPGLLKCLDDRDRSVRLYAADALGKIGPAAHDAIRILCKQLQDPDATVRLTAADALGGIGPAEESIRELRAALDDLNAKVRTQAALALWRLDPDNDRTFGELNDSLGDSSMAVKVAALRALADMGPAASTMTDRLTRMARKEIPEVRVEAAAALYRIDPKTD
jgi:HEAT repeat protein